MPRAQIDLNPPSSIALLDDPVHQQAVQSLAMRLQLAVVPVSAEALTYRLLLMHNASGQLAVARTEEFGNSDELRPGHPAWYTPEFALRRRAGGRDPLLRAVGYTTRTLVDCTAGWCVDAAHFAHHGIRVAAIEQLPVVFAILESARANHASKLIVENLTLHHLNSCDFLGAMEAGPEVIYIDPMYPARPGAAAAKRPLQILRALHQSTRLDDGAARELLHQARRCARRRIVVKRPHYAEPLDGGASGAITAKLVRFDLYPPL